MGTRQVRIAERAWSLGPQAPKELNKLLLLTSGALTNALDRLQAAGHIRRRPNPEDARSVLVELTAAGSQLAERLVALEMEAQAHQLMPLSRAEKKEVVEALDRLIGVL